MKKLEFNNMLKKFFISNGLLSSKASSLWAMIIAYIQTQLIQHKRVRVCDLGVFELNDKNDKIEITFKPSLTLRREIQLYVTDTKPKPVRKRTKQPRRK